MFRQIKRNNFPKYFMVWFTQEERLELHRITNRKWRNKMVLSHKDLYRFVSDALLNSCYLGDTLFGYERLPFKSSWWTLWTTWKSMYHISQNDVPTPKKFKKLSLLSFSGSLTPKEQSENKVIVLRWDSQ